MDRKLEERYRVLCRLYSQALEAIEQDDLEGAAARGEEADRLVAAIAEVHPPAGAGPEGGGPAAQARALHGQIMAALEQGRERTAADLNRTKH